MRSLIVLCLVLGIVSPLKANGKSACILKEGPNAIFDNMGEVYDWIQGNNRNQRPKVEVLLENLKKHTIYVRNSNIKFHTAYKLKEHNNSYIDISSCPEAYNDPESDNDNVKGWEAERNHGPRDEGL